MHNRVKSLILHVPTKTQNTEIHFMQNQLLILLCIVLV